MLPRTLSPAIRPSKINYGLPQTSPVILFAEPIPPQNPELQNAIRLFESHPDYPRIQVAMRTRLEAANNSVACIRNWTSEALLKFSRLRYDIWAEAHLEPVSDMVWLNAFKVLLNWWELVTLQDYRRAILHVTHTGWGQSMDFSPVQAPRDHWVKEGYQRVETHRQTQTSAVDSTTAEQLAHVGVNEIVDAVGRQRRADVDSYFAEVLRETGTRITRVDFWKAAGYRGPTEFERWQRNDLSHVNEEANRRFTQVLTSKPHIKKKS